METHPMRFAAVMNERADVFHPGKTGADLLHDPSLNKGSAFTQEERRQLDLVGLLPPRVCTMEQQEARILANIRRRSNDLSKYVEMISLLDRNETLFYKVLMDNIEEMMPIVYTPVVGAACQEYGHIFRRPRGLFITRRERGRIRDVLRRWPRLDVKIIVVTDGERILGLGDLGANGMGIPVGKLSLYTACGGVDPSLALPVTLDVGTNNEALLADPLYLGLPEPRLEGPEYDALVDEFIRAVQEVFPGAMIQFEDFGNRNAFRLLSQYHDRACVFNDDIQGTAAVALAGLYSAEKVTRTPLSRQRVLFYGAGEAAIGIGDLIVQSLAAGGMPKQEAAERCWFMDSKGLVESSRQGLQEHKKPYAHRHEPIKDLLTAVNELKPTALIGVSGKPGQFTEEVLREIARLNASPVIFVLSNPTANAECTAEEAYRWTSGRAVFASGSPFKPVTLNGRAFVPGQGNNAYIFPGVGLGVLLSGAMRVTNEMFLAAAKTLAESVTPNDLAQGRLYPPLARIREVSARIAAAVAEIAYKRALATRPRPRDLLIHARERQYQPIYKKYAL